MTSLELLEILGGVRGSYIQDAQKMRQGQKKPARRRYMRQLAAVVTLLLMLAAFLTTAPGAAAVEYVKEKVTSLIETLFPPKKMSILVEGVEVEGNYAASGVEPDQSTIPGFAIYYDTDHYTMVKEGDATYIRPIPIEGSNDDYLPCKVEMEIVHWDMPVEQAFLQEKEALGSEWEIRNSSLGDERAFLVLSTGQAWDSMMEDRLYVSDEQGGCFRLVSRFFLEAAEGHGVRFAAMMDTFAVLPAGETAQETTAGNG